MEAAAQKPPIGLALSGGGFRATLFHLGVVRFLYESGKLHKITHVCSVSGGSVIAAHLVLNWERYTGSESDFEEAARELVSFTQRDVRGRVIRRWLFSFLALGIPRIFFNFGRTDLLEKEYGYLYGKETLKTLRRSAPKDKVSSQATENLQRPELHILATSMTNGRAASFGPSMFQIRDDESYSEPIDIDTMKVSFAVTASSAFPPAFPPVRIDHERLNISRMAFQSRYGSRTQYLTDGGVFDNLGVRKFTWIQDEQKIQFLNLIVSDAQREFEGDIESRFRFIVGRATRTTEIMMNRISWFENNFMLGSDDKLHSRILRCMLKRRIKSDVEYSLNTREQSRVHNIRTDLDRFTDDEVNALVHHGYAVARLSTKESIYVEDSLNDKFHQTMSVWHPLTVSSNDTLNLSKSNKLKIKLLDFRDTFTWILFALIGIYALVVAGAYKLETNSKLRAAQQRESQIKSIPFSALNITDALAKLAAHDDFKEQECQEDLKAWYMVKNEVVSSNRFFKELFEKDNFGEEIDRAIDKWKEEGYNGTLRNRAVSLGKKIGIALIQENNSSYNTWLTNQRNDWFNIIEADANEIAKAEKYEHVANVSVKRFRTLYLGKLCLVEGKLVSEQMARFDGLLSAWQHKQLEEPEFGNAFTQLSFALRKERESDVTSVER
jgi:predicted acylesterase/phospholipase RssA